MDLGTFSCNSNYQVAQRAADDVAKAILQQLLASKQDTEQDSETSKTSDTKMESEEKKSNAVNGA